MNSSYLYNLIGEHFNKTSLVAKQNSCIVGFVSGYFLPNDPNILFIWQIGVDQSMQGKGLAKKLIATLLDIHKHKVTAIHTTVSPSNIPSNKLFDWIAKEHNTTIKHQTFLNKDDFEAGHEEEILKIIPIQKD